MKKKDYQIIKEINAEAWGKYGDRLFTEREKAPAVKKVAHLALNEEAHRFTDAQRGKIRAALDTGAFDGTERVVDEDVEKEYEEYISSRIQEEIDAGRLTHPEKANKKAQQYGRRKKYQQTYGGSSAGSDRGSEDTSDS